MSNGRIASIGWLIGIVVSGATVFATDDGVLINIARAFYFASIFAALGVAAFGDRRPK